MGFFQKQYSFPLVAEAAGMKHDTVAKWIARGDLVMRPEDREEIGRGGRKMLSAHTTLQLILAAELWRRGMSANAACEAAIQFSHFGDIKGQMGAKRDRKPGHLFPDGLTLFFPNRQDPASSKVRGYAETAPISEIRMELDAVDLEILFFRGLGGLGVDAHSAIAEMKEAG